MKRQEPMRYFAYTSCVYNWGEGMQPFPVLFFNQSAYQWLDAEIGTQQLFWRIEKVLSFFVVGHFFWELFEPSQEIYLCFSQNSLNM